MSIPAKVFLTIGVAAVYTAIIIVMAYFGAKPETIGFAAGWAVATFGYSNIPAIWFHDRIVR